MAIVGVGADVVDLERFRASLERTPGLLDRLFTADEQAYATSAVDPTERLAARFAAKEAVLKALASGLGAARLRDIEVVRAESGAPSLRLHETAAALAATHGVAAWHVSLSHSALVAQAFVVAEGF
ncbi:MAG: holo-ACP synthase [Acidimicrobiales bacterium]|nr:holo-ACP synthase [Acidimicrobiales bacterium]